MSKTVLVTGASGMIGSYVVSALLAAGHKVVGVDRRERPVANPDYTFRAVDLGDKQALNAVFDEVPVDRVIHLAALAHTTGEADLSYERFRHVNVECADNVFDAAESHGVPVLFISTVDALGMVKGPITPLTEPQPVSNYGRSKAEAESHLRQRCSRYDIYRLAPVYTVDVKRDIQKRYYLKPPTLAYRIGRGGQFEVLDVRRAVDAMSSWIEREPANALTYIKDDRLLDVNELIAQEKAEGRAKHVLWLPRPLVVAGYWCVRAVFGRSNKTYLVFKALWPFRTSNEPINSSH